jgi:uncharacterized protein YbbK (DUF523 family)
MGRKRPVAVISGCLIGWNCRYDGGSKPLPAEVLGELEQFFQLIPFCPEEVALPTPRPPARFVGDRVVDIHGVDKTSQFLKGAQETLALCRKVGAQLFIGKEKSPSCGVYLTSGYLNHREVKVCGPGVTTALLIENQIPVVSEWEVAPPSPQEFPIPVKWEGGSWKGKILEFLEG